MKRLGTDTQSSVTRDKMSLADMIAMARFVRNEDGALSIFSLFMFIMILMAAGVGVDLMMNEMKRTKLQHTLDRAILAAADLDQELEPSEVVSDYFAKAGLASHLQGVSVDEGLNYKEVSATAETVTDTIFMNLLGVDTLSAPAQGTAEERIGKVEVSMVLDISGSMRDNNKIQNLRGAAQTFVNTVLADETEDLISVSLVPYSEHVNAGPLLADRLNVDWKHGYSHCLEFPDSHFASTALNTQHEYEQMQHYQWNFDGVNNALNDTVCPRYSYERIRPWSQDADQLNAQIQQLQPRAGTSIFLGLKWGTALLDPSTRGILGSLVGAGEVDSTFAGRPVNYSDHESLKTVILMTDGQHDKSFRISDWAYNSPSEYYHWSRYNLNYYLWNYVSSYYHNQFRYQKYDATKGDTLLFDMCDAAKANGIVIWSIGFETQPHGSSVMRECASSPAHFFEVEGTAIIDAFTSIARQINQLRLTQ